MSITDELREYVQSWRENPNLMDDLDAGDIDGILGDFIDIADRIDAEHERECKKQYACGVEHGIGASIDASMIQTHGYVELPKDADGVPIHVGDELCNYTLSGYPYPNGGVYCKAIVNERMVLVGQKESSFKDLLMWEASWCHHHHAPTVEDVLRDVVTLCHNTWKEGSAFEFYDVDDVMKSGNIAEFAAKLRLAEMEDA